MNTETDKRDSLALERTRLANERTFLAYIRTGLSLLAASAVMFQFFASFDAMIAWGLAVSGVVVLGIGVVRFSVVRKRLNRG